MDKYKTLMEDGSYCMGIDRDDETKNPVVVVLNCFHQADPEIRFSVFPIGMIISIPFLLATFIVYALIPELRNVHGKSLMCYVFALTLAYAMLAFIQLSTSTESCRTGGDCLKGVSCVLSGYIVYFAFMVSFFWLNVMCFDIFWTFK